MKLTKKKLSLFIGFRVCYKYTPLLTFITILDALISSVIPFTQIVMVAWFINSSINIVNNGKSIKTVIIPVLIILAITGYNLFGKKIMEIIWLKIDLELKKKYNILLIQKSAKLQYKYIEDQHTIDLVKRICDNSEEKMRSVYKNLLEAFTIFAQIISIFALILLQSWWIAILILLITVPLLSLAVKAGKDTYDTDLIVTKYKRRFEYINKVFSGREAADERVLFQFYNFMNHKWHEFYEEFRKLEIKTILINNFRLESGSIITAILTIIIIICLLNPYFNGTMSIGLFMSLIGSIFNLIEVMSFSFTGVIRKNVQNREYIKELKEFFELSEEAGATDLPEKPLEFDTLEFQNVRFKYPGTDYYVLNGISFTMKKGKHYAFVGVNGSGKTTIIKLLTGLYRDYEGEILLNGRNMKEYELGKLKSIFSIVYQDFAKYALSVKENILLGNLYDYSNQDIESAARHAGLDTILSKLEDGMDTSLGRILEGGQDLSNGEWQRVAIARVTINKNSIQILDEPTSALDPLMENKIYEDFTKISMNKTTILISHRLGSTKLADTIYVLYNGRIAEKGYHQMLMEKNNIYSNMYRSQRKWYD